MCEFLTSDEHNMPQQIHRLEARIEAERHVCDALFATLMESLSNPSLAAIDKVRNLYGKLLLARTQNNYTEDIIDLAHEIIGNSISKESAK